MRQKPSHTIATLLCIVAILLHQNSSTAYVIVRTQTATYRKPTKTLPLSRNGRAATSMLASASDSSSTVTNGKSLNIFPKALRPSVESGIRYRSDDWLVNFLSIPNSFVLRRIKFKLLCHSVLCAIVVGLYKFGHFDAVALPSPLGHSLLGGFLGLLLVFRTNSAYGRFWEARGLWSKTKATCRSIALSTCAYLRNHSPRSSEDIIELVASFPDALANTCLAGSRSLPPHVAELIQRKDDGITNPRLGPALAICAKMHGAVHNAAKESSTSGTDYLEAMHLAEMSHEINSLVSTISSCEKIFKTPVPLSYSRHTSRFLTIWCGSLPFALVSQLGIHTLPVVIIACWCLFGIEEIGHLIEQPFVSVASKDMDQGNVPDPLYKGDLVQPYDIGLPVCTLAGRIRTEVLDIVSAFKKKDKNE
mmetsp:Transcript_22787/g.33469  ORF Transcript_22787/g.33469 Transcript_22787/m.33469 type:complete len:419 (+) Transcript_22787:35-1291(+)